MRRVSSKNNRDQATAVNYWPQADSFCSGGVKLVIKIPPEIVIAMKSRNDLGRLHSVR